MSSTDHPDWSLRLREPGQSALEHVMQLRAAGAPETDIRPWELGAQGERIAGRLLAQLDPHWTVLHDVPVGKQGANIDHVLISRAGVFTINTKHHPRADIHVNRSTLLVRGQQRDYITKAKFEGDRATSLLTACTGRFIHAQPILLFVKADNVHIVNQPTGILVTSDTNLLELLASITPEYTQRQVDELVMVAEQPETWTWTPAPATAPTTAQPDTWRPNTPTPQEPWAAPTHTNTGAARTAGTVVLVFLALMVAVSVIIEFLDAMGAITPTP